MGSFLAYFGIFRPIRDHFWPLGRRNVSPCIRDLRISEVILAFLGLFWLISGTLGGEMLVRVSTICLAFFSLFGLISGPRREFWSPGRRIDFNLSFQHQKKSLNPSNKSD